MWLSLSFMRGRDPDGRKGKLKPRVNSPFLFSTPSKDCTSPGKTNCEVIATGLPTFFDYWALSPFVKPSPLDCCHPQSPLSHVFLHIPVIFFQALWIGLRLSLVPQIKCTYFPDSLSRGRFKLVYLMIRGEAMVKSIASGARFSEFKFLLCHTLFLMIASYWTSLASVYKTVKWATESPYLISCWIKWVY